MGVILKMLFCVPPPPKEFNIYLTYLMRCYTSLQVTENAITNGSQFYKYGNIINESTDYDTVNDLNN